MSINRYNLIKYEGGQVKLFVQGGIGSPMWFVDL
jgi:hypothetical protein